MRANGSQTDNIEKIWYSSDFTGDNKPTARCTVHKGNVRLTHDNRWGDLASIIFSVGAEEIGGIFTYYPREIPRVQKVEWNRDVDSNIASATITIYNTATDLYGREVPGALTWNRGDSSFDKARGIVRDPFWYGMLVPDNVIRTFEGYGADYTVGPESDPHLVCTGNWLIDKVAYSSGSSGGIITITARDLGRVLSDQILFPPITPRHSPIPGIAYPISFDSYHTVSYAASEAYTPLFMDFDDSSSTPWVGHDGYQLGHFARQAMDGNQDTYWLSVGNGAPNAGYSFEWMQGRTHGETIGSVNVHALYANMQGYVSVFSNGAWVNVIGTIPYVPGGIGAPNGSDIPAVAQFVSTGNNQRVNFGPYPNVTKVRITFTNLQDSGVGPFVYRAGIREFGVYAAKAVAGGNKLVKESGWNYGDYTDIVKLLCAWGGFHWPKPSDQPFIAVSKAAGFPNGVAFELNPSPPNDNYLKNGRVWGDIEQTGTYGIVPLLINQFDKKTILDAIVMIQQTVGFLFMIDESGGIVWRQPNYFQRGNRIQQTGQRVQRFIRILDTQTLQQNTVTLDSRNARERVYVATADGKAVGSAQGYNLNPIGLRRIAGWIDYNWANNHECQVAAQQTALQQMLTYRTLALTIAGLPTMQIDDQVEVVDSETGEGYLHYVRGIHSTLDMSAGTYVYDLSTSWLGAKAGTEWVINKYGGLSADFTTLLDSYDRGRRDGAYDSFAPVTLIPGP